MPDPSGLVTRALYVVALFLIAGLCEIGGGWFIWQAIRNAKPYYFAVVGGILLVLYGVVASFQTLSFSTTYASYGGYFIALSLLWGWVVDKQIPITWDFAGAGICLVGASVIAFAPRKQEE